VVLSELNELNLGQVVVTGVGTTARSSAAGAPLTMAKAASPDSQRRVAAKSATQSTAQPEVSALSAPAAQSAVAPARAPTVMADIAIPYNTIAWTDSATGKKMTLSGHHSAAELEEIRARIERVRTQQPAEKKKEP
jgi:hypothetical protein